MLLFDYHACSIFHCLLVLAYKLAKLNIDCRALNLNRTNLKLAPLKRNYVPVSIESSNRETNRTCGFGLSLDILYSVCIL